MQYIAILSTIVHVWHLEKPLTVILHKRIWLVNHEGMMAESLTLWLISSYFGSFRIGLISFNSYLWVLLSIFLGDRKIMDVWVGKNSLTWAECFLESFHISNIFFHVQTSCCLQRTILIYFHFKISRKHRSIFSEI